MELQRRASDDVELQLDSAALQRRGSHRRCRSDPTDVMPSLRAQRGSLMKRGRSPIAEGRHSGRTTKKQAAALGTDDDDDDDDESGSTLTTPAVSRSGSEWLPAAPGSAADGGFFTSLFEPLEGVGGSPPVQQQTSAAQSKQDMPLWTVEEDLLILQLVEQHGKRWSKIAAQLPGRTDNGVRNRWNRMERAQLMKQRRGAPAGYRCRRCGEPKRGHICAARTLNGQPETAEELHQNAAALTEISAQSIKATLAAEASQPAPPRHANTTAAGRAARGPRGSRPGSRPSSRPSSRASPPLPSPTFAPAVEAGPVEAGPSGGEAGLGQGLGGAELGRCGFGEGEVDEFLEELLCPQGKGLADLVLRTPSLEPSLEPTPSYAGSAPQPLPLPAALPAPPAPPHGSLLSAASFAPLPNSPVLPPAARVAPPAAVCVAVAPAMPGPVLLPPMPSMTPSMPPPAAAPALGGASQLSFEVPQPTQQPSWSSDDDASPMARAAPPLLMTQSSLQAALAVLASADTPALLQLDSEDVAALAAPGSPGLVC